MKAPAALPPNITSRPIRSKTTMMGISQYFLFLGEEPQVLDEESLVALRCRLLETLFPLVVHC